MYAAISQGESGLRLGLVPGGSLITSLKQRVVALASNNGVLSTVQTAAQAVLQNGWSLLLPTAEERARALSALLPTAGITHTDTKNLSLLISLVLQPPVQYSHVILFQT